MGMELKWMSQGPFKVGPGRSSRGQFRGRMHSELHLYTHNRREREAVPSGIEGCQTPSVVARIHVRMYVRARAHVFHINVQSGYIRSIH